MRADDIREHLIRDIIPFWKKLKDEQQGGFYGELSYDLILNKQADKGCILNSRILWFFSNAYITLGDEECKICAAHAYNFLKKAFYDWEYGGVYWSATYDGKPKDTSKHTYNQAFAIYALAAYYRVTRDEEVLKLAYELVDCLEKNCRDEKGYLEAFDRTFQPVVNEKLSENGVMASRTMNTLLHIFEAYTELYLASQDRYIGERMVWILDIFADRIYNPKKRRLEVFFDIDYNSLIDLSSYGHDIEASWLIDRGVEVLGDPDLDKKISPITKTLAAQIYESAMDEDSLLNECEEGRVDTRKIWWVQAEAILGFINGYEKDKSRSDYLDAARRIWDFIRKFMIDPREGSEWLNELHKDGSPITTKEIVGPWKCPYHNGRMCLEVIRRGVAL